MFVQPMSSGRDRLVTSASDLSAASACEFGFLRRVDKKLGRNVNVRDDDDPMLARAGELGDEHEARELSRLQVALGVADLDAEAARDGDETGLLSGVVEISRPRSMGEHDLEEVAAETLRALCGRADVVFQATFFEPAQRPGTLKHPEIGFIGFADFLELQPDGSYEVQDTKLARTARVTALMQLAAYAEQLERLGVPVHPEATLILGSGERSTHRLADIAPVFRRRRARLHELLLERAAATGADGRRETADPVAWGAPGIAACGRCVVCEPEVLRTRDPLLISGITRKQRDALVAGGLDTVEMVATTLDKPEGGRAEVTEIPAATLERLAMQAQVQIDSERTGKPAVRVIAAHELAAIPPANPGDLFFDFEGDPFYSETGADGVVQWNLDYLFGMVDTEAQFTPLWAHSLAEEKQALIDFIALVQQRRRNYPGMHIYHYAAYERTHLLSIAARHGVCEAEVDELLRNHVLVDLYPIVRRALRVGSRSYSIKKLEPLYMGDELRDADGVTDGGQSVAEYAEASALLASSSEYERAEGQRRLDAIEDYNRYDCVSTLKLRDWLLQIAETHGVVPHPREHLEHETEKTIELSQVGADLLALAAAETDELRASALRLASSAIDYHEREQKSFWWAHYARLVDPIEDWADTRDVMVVDPDASELVDDWHTPQRARVQRRHLRLRGVIAPGSSFKPGNSVFAVYDRPTPFPVRTSEPGARGVRSVKVLERFDDGISVEETLGNDTEPYVGFPTAITPGAPPHAGRQKSAIEEWGTELVAAQTSGVPFLDPVMPLLMRARPELTPEAGETGLVDPASLEALRVGGNEDHRAIGAVVASLRRLNYQALAVQGPPGTGKTYLAARVIRMLVEENGWKIGVVAQSHQVVENVLEGVVRAGLDSKLVGKAPQQGADQTDREAPLFTRLKKDGHGQFLDGISGSGGVIGGTAWDFSHEGRVARRSLDLLVIDEAGQFSLAPTIASAVSATRLLLLGDPQQLPQVSQGSHPEPVDTAALSWLLGDNQTMPEGYGYFLADTRRMHPSLAGVVSNLAYEGRLHAHPTAGERVVQGPVAPGLHWHPVPHNGNSTYSVEEAEAIVATVRELAEHDISEAHIIVVAAYNAQVECVSDALGQAGFPYIRVGTVDKFQGQEAVFVLVSLAASSAEEIPRGVEFLLMRNRLNVAISRAQWAAILFSSPKLGDGLPTSVAGVTALSGYLGLTEQSLTEQG